MYRIYDLVPDFINKEAPCAIDYKRSIKQALLRTDHFDHGRLVKVEFKNNSEELVLDIVISYNESTGNTTYPLERTTTRKWYDIVGTNHDINDFDKTTKLKKYNAYQTKTESIKRRSNIVLQMFSTAVSIGYSTEANARITNNAAEIESYKLTGDTALITVIQNDTATWLSDIPAGYGALTMKQIIVGALTL